MKPTTARPGNARRPRKTWRIREKNFGAGLHRRQRDHARHRVAAATLGPLMTRLLGHRRPLTSRPPVGCGSGPRRRGPEFPGEFVVPSDPTMDRGSSRRSVATPTACDRTRRAGPSLAAGPPSPPLASLYSSLPANESPSEKRDRGEIEGDLPRRSRECMSWFLHNAIADLCGPYFLLFYAMAILMLIVAAGRSIRAVDRSRDLGPPEIPAKLGPL